MKTLSKYPYVVVLLGLARALASRADDASRLSRPDPKSVERYGPAYRYPQAGWIVLHIEGEPYERGYQHGRLMASDIAAHLRCFANVQSHKSPSDGWRATRTLTNALFVRRYSKEFLEEMKGIADGAAAGGAKFDDRPLDLLDIVALNSWAEIESLDSALEATPNGLEGMRFPKPQHQVKPAARPMHCSAFAATGPATTDGKVILGHITMFGLYPSYFYNVWLDVKPAKGHRVLMQTYPGGMQSGMDYYYNDAGLVVCETTIAQTPFAVNGMTEGSRIREALQYADTIDRAVDILKQSNNGLYTNEWLLADIKTNEIAMFELGTAKSKLYRSGKNEWFGDTPGFYWGCNNTKDLEVRLETVANTKDRPANMVFRPSDRDTMWQRLYEKHKGKIGVEFGKEAFTTPPIAAYHSVDAKFTTTDLARELKTWALFGPPLGRTWQPTQDERQRHPDIKPLVSNPWTILHTLPPPGQGDTTARAVDLGGKSSSPDGDEDPADEDDTGHRGPAWHGTLLAKGDADTWLAASFADFERIVAHTGGKQSSDRDRLTLDLFGQRSAYLAAARASADTPLGQTRADLRDNRWYRVASGKGVWLLQELRRLMGEKPFALAMDAFGRGYAGKPVTAAEFQAEMEKAAGPRLGGFFDFWLRQPGLPPALRLERATSSPVKTNDGDERWQVEGEISREGPGPRTVVDVTVETDQDEVTRTFDLEGTQTAFRIATANRPLRVQVDKYGRTAKANGAAFSTNSYAADLEHTLIVYGTLDEATANREAAEALQRGIRERGSNYTVPVKEDRLVSEEELRSRHLILVGRPDSNALVERFRPSLPATFGQRSFRVGSDDYAHARSALVVAAENPLDRRYSVVVLAGLSAEATARVPAQFLRQWTPAEVLVLPNRGSPRSRVLPPVELGREFGDR